MSTWKDDSDLSRLHRAAAGEAVDAAAVTVEVLELAAGIVDRTGGAFDPTIGPLVALGASTAPTSRPRVRPTRTSRRRGLVSAGQPSSVAKPPSRAPATTSRWICRRSPRACRRPRRRGARGRGGRRLPAGRRRAVLRGVNRRGTPWRIGIDDPRHPRPDAEDPASVMRRAPLRGGRSHGRAVATSGDYRTCARSATGSWPTRSTRGPVARWARPGIGHGGRGDLRRADALATAAWSWDPRPDSRCSSPVTASRDTCWSAVRPLARSRYEPPLCMGGPVISEQD